MTAVNSAWQQDNITDDLKSRGLSQINRLRRMYDINPSGGGPIQRDKLWFYVSARFQENKNYIGGLYENKNAGDPTKWLYEPDPSKQVIFSLNQDSGNGRLTWQAAEKHKLTFFYDQQRRPWDDNRPGVVPEASSWWRFPRLRTTQVGWTSPLTNRLLFEGRFSNRGEHFQDVFQGTTPRRDLIGVLEQGGQIPGLLYRGHGPGAHGPFQLNNMPTLSTVLFNVSYVTGAHAVKFGFTDSFGHQIATVNDIPESLAYRFRDGVPNLITMRATPYEQRYQDAGGDGPLRSGQVDDRQADADRRPAVRLAQLLLPGKPHWAGGARPHAEPHDSTDRISELEGRDATGRCGVRPVW